jgi:hypothetical protein
MELSELISDILTGTALGRPNWSFILSGGNMFAQFCLAIAGKIIGFFAAWIMLPAISIGLFAHGNYTGAIIAIGFWGLYVVYRLIMIPAGWRNRRLRGKAAEKLNERLEAMMKAWNAARGAAINPSRLKELVLGAEERGAMFPSVLHTIIDRAIKRDPTVLTRVR